MVIDRYFSCWRLAEGCLLVKRIRKAGDTKCSNYRGCSIQATTVLTEGCGMFQSLTMINAAKPRWMVACHCSFCLYSTHTSYSSLKQRQGVSRCIHPSRVFGHSAGGRVLCRSEPRHRQSTDTMKQTVGAFRHARGRYRSDLPHQDIMPVWPDLL
jgi:hypothetical protein